MAISFHNLRSRRLLAVLLVLPGLLLRAVVPAGFMPAVGPDHVVTMVVCPGHASTAMQMPVAAEERGNSGHVPGQRHHEPPCAYAAATGVAPLPVLADVALVSVPADAPVVEARVTPSQRALHSAYAPRAPPGLC